MMRRRSRRSPGREFATMAGGLVAGLAASRFLPPLFAMASGSVRAKLGRDPFELLVRDHQKILATVRKMEAAGNQSTATRTALLLALKRTLGKHALAEEDVVYPLLHDQAGGAEPSKHLYDEHADMKIHLYHLEAGVADPVRWEQHARALRELIEGHIRDEEEVEFPRLRTILDERKSARVSGQIRREEALVL